MGPTIKEKKCAITEPISAYLYTLVAKVHVISVI